MCIFGFRPKKQEKAHLTLEQRYAIQYLRSEGLTQSAIAEKIGKDVTAICVMGHIGHI